MVMTITDIAYKSLICQTVYNIYTVLIRMGLQRGDNSSLLQDCHCQTLIFTGELVLQMVTFGDLTNYVPLTGMDDF